MSKKNRKKSKNKNRQNTNNSQTNNQINLEENVKNAIIKAQKEMDDFNLKKSEHITNWLRSFLEVLLVMIGVFLIAFGIASVILLIKNICSGFIINIYSLTFLGMSIFFFITGNNTIKISKKIFEIDNIANLTGITSFVVSALALIISFLALGLQYYDFQSLEYISKSTNNIDDIGDTCIGSNNITDWINIITTSCLTILIIMQTNENNKKQIEIQESIIKTEENRRKNDLKRELYERRFEIYNTFIKYCNEYNRNQNLGDFLDLSRASNDWMFMRLIYSGSIKNMDNFDRFIKNTRNDNKRADEYLIEKYEFEKDKRIIYKSKFCFQKDVSLSIISWMESLEKVFFEDNNGEENYKMFVKISKQIEEENIILKMEKDLMIYDEI